ncbi:MAG: hypothetical protein APR53_03265 [Methanoculleus sp. SDB]|nr:MAG: hypothetical protein APR53_03265 [Methanoculleus sp. SDB]
MAQFSVKTRVFFGKTGSKEAVDVLLKEGMHNIVCFVDSHLNETAPFRDLIALYRESGLRIRDVKQLSITAEPTYALVDDVAETMRGTDADAIVAVGGGSLMDIAKSVAILLTNPGQALDYRGMDRVKNPGVPVICYPTTAGTGSEVTHTASLIDAASKKKLGINGKNVTPFMAVLIPELTFSCPPGVTIASGLDAMIHAIEAVTAKNASKITKMLGTRAFALLYANFLSVLSEPDNYEARENMLLGSYYAGIAMLNAGGGPASGISYPLGTYFGVPHGIAGGVFLPHVVWYNVKKGYHGYRDIYDSLPDADLWLGEDEKSLDFAKRISSFCDSIGAPANLSPFNVKPADISFIAGLTLEQRMENLKLNPVPIDEDGVVELLRKVISHG